MVAIAVIAVLIGHIANIGLKQSTLAIVIICIICLTLTLIKSKKRQAKIIIIINFILYTFNLFFTEGIFLYKKITKKKTSFQITDNFLWLDEEFEATESFDLQQMVNQVYEKIDDIKLNYDNNEQAVTIKHDDMSNPDNLCLFVIDIKDSIPCKITKHEDIDPDHTVNTYIVESQYESDGYEFSHCEYQKRKERIEIIKATKFKNVDVARYLQHNVLAIRSVYKKVE